MEYGWGGRELDPASHQPIELTKGASLWGHNGLAPNPEADAAMRALRIEMATKPGLREPVHVIQGNFQPMHGVCPWWDGLKAAG